MSRDDPIRPTLTYAQRRDVLSLIADALEQARIINGPDLSPASKRVLRASIMGLAK